MLNAYWQAVLQEILNKNDPNYPIRFTNVREYKSAQPIPSAKGKKPKTNYTHYYLSAEKKGVYLTHRETLAVLHRLAGKTYNQVAAALNIRTRTVEFYLKSIRNKLHCERTSEVLAVLIGTDFFKRYQLKNGKIQLKNQPDEVHHEKRQR